MAKILEMIFGRKNEMPKEDINLVRAKQIAKDLELYVSPSGEIYGSKIQEGYNNFLKLVEGLGERLSKLNGNTPLWIHKLYSVSLKQANKLYGFSN